jgi:pimeloyl-ACP methyl ester carboxylesterase
MKASSLFGSRPLWSWAAAGACVLTIVPMAQGADAPRIDGPAGALFVDGGGLRTAAAAPPVLFVHSFAGNSTHWKEQLQHLRKTRRTAAMDLRGHGRSQIPANGAYAIESLAADIGAVADALRLQRFVLVGHSMGGAAAAAYAGMHPDRVAGLVLVGAPGKSPPEVTQKVMAGLKSDYDKTMAGYWQSLLIGARAPTRKGREAEMRRVQHDNAMAMIEATFAFDPLPALARYPGPTLIVDTAHGEGPGALHNQVPQVERSVIERTSHWPQLDDPKAFDRVLDGFLAKLG